MEQQNQQDTSFVAELQAFFKRTLQTIITSVIFSAGTILIGLIGGYIGIINAIKDENTTNKIQEAQIKELSQRLEMTNKEFNMRLDKAQVEIDHLRSAIYKPSTYEK